MGVYILFICLSDHRANTHCQLLFYHGCIYTVFVCSFHLCPLAAALGLLPPAGSLASVPVSSLSVQSPFVSWAGSMNTNTSWSSTTNPLTATTNPWPHAGVTLSPASETFPRRLVDKVRSGQFTEMKARGHFLAILVSLLPWLRGTEDIRSNH